MNLRINSHNSFCAKMIPEGFGIRSVDAKRWANIADLFEKAKKWKMMQKCPQILIFFLLMKN